MIGDQDVLELAGDVELRSGGLYDPVRGGSARLNATAAGVLRRSLSVGSLAAELERQFGLAPAGARAHARVFAAQLNAALVANVVPRGGSVTLALRWLRLSPVLLALGRLPRWPARRRPLDTSSALGGAAAAAIGSLTPAVSLAAMILLVASPATLGGPAVLAAAVAAAGGSALALAVHEGAHAALLRGVPACLVTRPLRAAVLHRPLSPRREAAVAFAGPAAGVLISAALLALAAAFAELAPAASLVSAQALGLTVLAKDGRTICAAC